MNGVNIKCVSTVQRIQIVDVDEISQWDFGLETPVGYFWLCQWGFLCFVLDNPFGCSLH